MNKFWEPHKRDEEQGIVEKTIDENWLGIRVLIETHDGKIYEGRLSALPTAERPFLKLSDAWIVTEWGDKGVEYEIPVKDIRVCEPKYAWQAPVFFPKR